MVLAIGALAAVPASTHPAVAESAQPTAVEDVCTPGSPNAIPDWETRFTGRGVTLCRGYDSFGLNDAAFVQIVDLSAGAKVRMISQVCPTSECPVENPVTDLRFRKKTAHDWFNWTRGNISIPGPARLFSTSNGSFFTDADNATSPLSLPEMHNVMNLPDGPQVVLTMGWALTHQTDLAYGNPKQAIWFGDASAPHQKVQVQPFTTKYTNSDCVNLFFFDEERPRGDAVVGFTPEFDGGTGSDRRTYVGVDNTIFGLANKVFILNTDDDFTSVQAQTILSSFGALSAVQLDGGGSTQLDVDHNQDGISDTLIDSDDPRGDRPVPDTLAVYLAP